MRPVIWIVSGIALLAVCGCGDPTIDTSSDETMKQSVQEVRDALPESRREEFDEAMQVLAFSQIDMKDIFAEGAAGTGNLESKVRQSLDGKTGEQVIAEAERIKAERREREREQALEEIRELDAKRLASEDAREQLKRFRVTRSRFYLRDREFMGQQPVIELTVENGTDEAVSRAFFEGTLASPNRSVPWHKDTFNYSIPGGLEPGEEATWKLAPNMFSDWGDVRAPSDAVFTVTVEQIDGADGEPLYSAREFDEDDLERLIELKKRYGIE